MSKRILVAASALIVAACSTQSAVDTANANAKASDFRVTDAQRQRLTIVTLATTRFRPTIEVTGTVAFNGDHSTQVLSPISGPVTHLLVNPGASVTEGQALATVASPDFATAVATYRKAIEVDRNAKRIFKLDQQLFQNDALARSDLDQATADAAAAAADVDASQQALQSLGVDDATVAAIRDGRQAAPIAGAIRAPITGTVVEKLVNPGQLLEAGATPAFTVADLHTMWVFANVYEGDLAFVAAGQRAEIVTEAAPRPVVGHVDYVAALVDPGTKATSVRIVAENPGAVLKRDMYVRIRIHSDRERTGILIPPSALLRDENNLPFVFIAKDGGAFERRSVTVGYRVGDSHEITSGLAAGDKVVANGALFIQFAESQ